MAPFRSRDRSNRSGRGQVEHNVLEGLPIHQYRETFVTIGANSNEKPVVAKDAWPELPMPRDSHLLPEHSQQLLRAARAGRLYQLPPPPDDEKENPEDEEEAPAKEVQTGFTIKKYVKVPRHLEEPEPEYLAKRRKGLPSPYSVYNVQSGTQPAAPPMRETKVKKVDAEGNVNVYKVLVPEGQTVEGEVQEADVAAVPVPAVAAPGTVVEGVGVVNADGVVVANEAVQTPPRRRPPPPKKKGRKGPGRGKKKVVFEAGTEGTRESTTPALGTDTLGVPNVKQEPSSVNPSDVDTPMADAPEGEDEEGDEGEDGSEDEDREEGEVNQRPSTKSESPVKNPQPQEIAPVSDNSTVTKSESKDSGARRTSRDPSSSPELPLATAIAHSRQNSLNQVPVLPPNVIPAEESAHPSAQPVSTTPTEQPPDSIIEAHVESSVQPAVLDATPIGIPTNSAAEAPVGVPVGVPIPTAIAPSETISAVPAEVPVDIPVAAPVTAAAQSPHQPSPAVTSQVSIEMTSVGASVEAQGDILPGTTIDRPTEVPPVLQNAPVLDSSTTTTTPPTYTTSHDPQVTSEPPAVSTIAPAPDQTTTTSAGEVKFPDGDTDLLGSLERQLEESSKSMATS